MTGESGEEWEVKISLAGEEHRGLSDGGSDTGARSCSWKRWGMHDMDKKE